MAMSDFWENELVEIAAYYSVAVLCLVLFLTVFELVTAYKNWEEIQKGNLAVAMATGGKILGIANVFQHSISQHNSLLQMIGWGVYGVVMLLISYFIFEFLTPRFKIDQEIENDNRAVGFISFVISVGLSFVVAAGI
ncbi:putative integral inner membrane protein [Bacillus subtilis XF-1]|nr:putative integral inner membrane protein [Bacillus subtilis XF-1]